MHRDERQHKTNDNIMKENEENRDVKSGWIVWDKDNGATKFSDEVECASACYAVRVLNFDFIYDDAIPTDIREDVEWIKDFYFELLDQREIGNHSWELAYKALEESRSEWLRIWIRKKFSITPEVTHPPKTTRASACYAQPIRLWKRKYRYMMVI